MRRDVYVENDSGGFSVLAADAVDAMIEDQRSDDFRFVAGYKAMLLELYGDDSMPVRIVVDEPLFRATICLVFAIGIGQMTGCAMQQPSRRPYTVSGSSLSFGAVIMTRMACADGALNAQETAFAAALGETDHYTVAGDTLTLLAGSTRRVRLVH